MIVIDNLSKQFNGKFVVENINLKIKQGEIIGLLGPNGAGKTTTLRMIAGVLPPTYGRVNINDLDIKDNEYEVKKLIGFLPENNPLFDELTVEEYLEFWIKIKGITKENKKEAIDFVVENCGIGEVFYRLIGELSKGYRQRVGLSQAILTKPQVLILDEPTEGLDPNQRHEIASLIRNLGKERTVIISSHVLSELTRIVSRMVVIHKGKIVADETPDNLKKIGKKTNVVEVEIKGKNVLKTLKKISGAVEVEEKKPDWYIITSDRKIDLRERVFKMAVSQKWLILTMMMKEKEIEEVFAQLTNN